MVMDWVFLLDTAPQQIHLSPEVLLNVLSLSALKDIFNPFSYIYITRNKSQ